MPAKLVFLAQALRASSVVVLLFLLAPPHATAQWTTASLAQARSELSATSVGGLAIFAGGYFSSGVSTMVDIYNASYNNWTTTALSQARYRLAATSVGGLALFAGGANNSNAVSSVVDIYNASSNNWTIAALSKARYFLTATSVGGLALFAGGTNASSGESLAVVDIYNASSNNWTTAALSQARSFSAATCVGDLALFAGGLTDAGGLSSVVDIYNASSNNWTTTALSQARYYLAATSIGDLALFAGGISNAGLASAVVDIYNASSNNWTTAALSQARYYLAATSIGGLALFAGGSNGSSGVSSAVVDIYDASSNSWTVTLSQARYGLTATSIGDLALFAGGHNGSTYSSVVDIFNQSAWSPPSPSASPTPSITPTPTPSPSSSPSPSRSPTPTSSPSVSPSVSVTPSVAPIASVPVAAEFSLTVPAVAISQSGGDTGTTAQQVDLGLVSLEEIADTTVLQAVDLQTVGWMASEPKNGSAQSGDTTEYIFTSHLATATDGANNATLQYFFTTFASDRLITTESNYSFTVTPALLKFSLNISSWAWNSPSSKLRLTLKISPSFVRFTRWDDTPQAGMTTFLFSSPNAQQASAIVRLLDFGEAAEGVDLSRVLMECSAAVNSSSLSITFAHFEGTLLFDPDFGLLLGSNGGSGGKGSGDLGLIVGVAVAIPLAVVFVVGVITVVLTVIIIKRRIALANSRGAVGFDPPSDGDDQQL